jgi:hypothetical protein
LYADGNVIVNAPFTAGGDCDRLYCAAIDSPENVTLEFKSTNAAGFRGSSFGFEIVTLINWFGAEPNICLVTMG